MPSPPEQQPPHPHYNRTWTRDDGYFISTDSSLIPLDSLNEALESAIVYWAKGLPTAALRAMVDNSLSFGLYASSPAETNGATTDGSSTPGTAGGPPPLIGFARLVTDYVTFAYLTDVYVLSEWQGRGLGKWLIERVQEVIEAFPHLRRSTAFTSRELEGGGSLVGWYGQLMKMRVLDGSEPYAMLEWKGPGRVF